MVPRVFKCIINGTTVFYFYPKWYLITQNNLFRNQPDETIEAVNKKKMKLTKNNNNMDDMFHNFTFIHIQCLDLKMYIHHFE
jgi:hypothetical protein